MYLQSAVESGAACGGVGSSGGLLQPFTAWFLIVFWESGSNVFNEVPRHIDRRKENSICGYIWLLNVVYLFVDMFFKTQNHS